MIMAKWAYLNKLKNLCYRDMIKELYFGDIFKFKRMQNNFNE